MGPIALSSGTEEGAGARGAGGRARGRRAYSVNGVARVCRALGFGGFAPLPPTPRPPPRCCLQDTLGDVNEHLAKRPQMQHLWGVRWLLRPWDMGTQFLWECKKVRAKGGWQGGGSRAAEGRQQGTGASVEAPATGACWEGHAGTFTRALVARLGCNHRVRC